MTASAQQSSAFVIPTRLEEVDSAWLTATLRAAGVIERSAIEHFESTRIGDGRGFAGQIARLSLRYDRPERGAPATIVVKVASDHERTVQTVGSIDAYAREVRFYRELAPRIGISTPGCYFAHHDPQTGRFCLLLEDMAPAASPDRDAGLTLEQARELLTQLAGLHARWWDRGGELPWLQLSTQLVQVVYERYLDAVPGFLAAYEARYPTMCKAAVMLGELALGDELIPMYQRRPQTLTHNDLHLENLVLPTERGGRFALLDWQLLGWSRHGASDIARVLSLGMQPALRRAHQDALLRHYHRELSARGVRGYRLRTLRFRVREEQLSTLMVMVVASVNLQFTPEDQKGIETLMERAELALRDARLLPLLRAVQLALRCKRALARVFVSPPKLPAR